MCTCSNSWNSLSAGFFRKSPLYFQDPFCQSKVLTFLTKPIRLYEASPKGGAKLSSFVRRVRRALIIPQVFLTSFADSFFCCLNISCLKTVVALEITFSKSQHIAGGLKSSIKRRRSSVMPTSSFHDKS